MKGSSRNYRIVLTMNYFFYCRVNIIYIDKTGKHVPIQGKVGDNVLYLAHRYGIELEGIILEPEYEFWCGKQVKTIARSCLILINF